jgi:adenylosuccinate synthase
LDYDEFQNYDLVFEGAQGLLLDQTFGFFPHVTRSNTGTKNIIKILENFPIIDELKVNHITRVYTTRHGAGPLSYEQDFPERIIDNTNHSHLFQGALRYSPLNYDEMGRVISLDLQCQEISYRYEINNIMTMTCLDQLDDTVQFIMGEELHQISKELFIENVYRMHDYVSYGPTRKDVIEL